jgi:AraC family transcriptional regulator, alkane utilization regulator
VSYAIESAYGCTLRLAIESHSDSGKDFLLWTPCLTFSQPYASGETVEVKAGELLLLPHDRLYLLGTDLELPPAGMEDIIGFRKPRDWRRDNHKWNRVASPPPRRIWIRVLLGSLPPMLRIPLGDVSTSGWLPDLLPLGVQESLAQRPGSQSPLAKLSLAFIEALRRYAQSETPDLKGWLAGLHDPHVGRALACCMEIRPAAGQSTNERVRSRCLARRWRSASPT